MKKTMIAIAALGTLTSVTKGMTAFTSENGGSSTPSGCAMHGLVIVDTNATDLATALGINEDRRKELDKDIILAIGNAENGTAKSLVDLIFVASQHAQSDNEMGYAIATITEAFAFNNAGAAPMSAMRQNLEAKDGIEPTDESVEARDGGINGSADEDTDGLPEGLGEFLRQMLAQRAAAYAQSEQDEYRG